VSYCRFSSDNWKSDVYCYKDVYGGYVTQVAGRRYTVDFPPMPDSGAPGEEWMRGYRAHLDAVAAAELRPIGLACDGQAFLDATLDDLLTRLLDLQRMGYHVPESALKEIRAEIGGET